MKQIGTFRHCSNCKLIKCCCENFDIINAPVINKNELNNIKSILQKNDFYDYINDNLFYLKTMNNKCIFFENNKCSIYNNRPLDCRLFPYDVIKIKNEFYLIMYLLDCICEESIKKEDVDEIIKKIIPWINDFTLSINYSKMENIKYKIIKKIKI